MAINTALSVNVQTNITDDNSKKFSVASSIVDKFANMLGSSLYSDKEYAVLSELGANACDIHTRVGKENVPFSLHLPTTLSPNVIIRDYGTGLSKEDVYRFLTTYGESDKGTTNSEIGMWGLGAKSPSAVSDAWGIISYHNGVRSQYEVFISSNNVPTITKVLSVKTSEPSGLEIIIPAQQSAKWSSAAVRAFEHYKVKPICNIDLRYPSRPESLIEKKNWRCFPDTNPSYPRIKVIVGNRGYVLDVFSVLSIANNQTTDCISTDSDFWLFVLTSSFTNRPYNPIFQELIKNNPSLQNGDITYGSALTYELFFSIGEIDVSLSRESIQYNQRTVNNIINRLNEIGLDIKNIFKDEMSLSNTTKSNGISYRLSLTAFLKKYKSNVLLAGLIRGNKYEVNFIPDDLAYPMAGVVRTPIHVVNSRGTVYSAGRSTRNSRVNWRFNAFSIDMVADKDTGMFYASMRVNLQLLDSTMFVVNDVRGSLTLAKRLRNDSEYDNYNIIVVIPPGILDKTFFKLAKVIKASSLKTSTKAQPVPVKKGDNKNKIYLMSPPSLRTKNVKATVSYTNQLDPYKTYIGFKMVNKSTLSDVGQQGVFLYLIKTCGFVVGYPNGVVLPSNVIPIEKYIQNEFDNFTKLYGEDILSAIKSVNKNTSVLDTIKMLSVIQANRTGLI